MPIQWQLILTNEGSFTEVLKNLTGAKVYVKTSQKYNYQSQKHIRNIRYVWLETSIYTKLTFARSLWIFIYNDKNLNLINTEPIGQSFIHKKIDIYRDIHEISYGYCKYLERYFISKQPIWGRKYTLCYDYSCHITIQEFFSPYILNLFN